MTASPPPPAPPLARALLDVREMLERARRNGDRREIEAAMLWCTGVAQAATDMLW